MKPNLHPQSTVLINRSRMNGIVYALNALVTSETTLLDANNVKLCMVEL